MQQRISRQRAISTLKRQQSPPQATAVKTGSADAAEGSVAVSGIVIGDINLLSGAPVHTRYREQILRIVPPALVGRDVELAELSKFCTAPESDQSYLWWRGDAWAGKSALMSWFVLNPPPGIRVVSFFITARFASQDNRGAFIENVLEQLATLLGEPMPAYLTDSTRDAHLLGMLSDAARACEARGERLVLAVDGLDEDRGVTTGPDAYSIAALLPDPPPAGMRIVVAGRLNPPIPADVPEHHRLRDPAIVRRLAASPFAAVVRNNMERELKRLLVGSQAEQDLLGLLTAARGGLTASDLAELTDRPDWQVEDELRTVTGRSFSTRLSHWLPGIRPDVYVLGHEELQETAKNQLGSARLGVYRQRLHAWAGKYRDQGWPESTPEYLLRGYYRMLMATGDLERMIQYATDRRRHNRMLDISGGDNAAIEEIIAAQDVIVREPGPDLTAMARLAVFRDYLADRNTTVPFELPAAWASLGQLKRGEALAGSIIRPGRHALSLVELVKALTATGNFRHAEVIARSITHDGRRGEATMALLRGLAMAGNMDSAEELLQSITHRGERTIGLINLALAAAEGGHVTQAQGFIARADEGLSSVTHPRRRGEALATLAEALAVVGDATRAHSLIAEAEVLVSSIEQPSRQAAVWAALIRASAAVEGQARARERIDVAETLSREISEVASRAGVVVSLARAATAIGDNVRARSLIGEAEGLIRSIKKPRQQADLWPTLLRAAALVDVERVPRLTTEAEAMTRSIALRESQATAFAVLSRAMTAVGDMERARQFASEAEGLTRSVMDPERRGRDLAALAKVAAAEGLVDQAEEIARSISGSWSRNRVDALISVAKAAAIAGDPEHAKDIVQSITNPGQQAGALAALAKYAAETGNLRRAEVITQSITSPGPKAEALIGLAIGHAVAGNLDCAEALALSIPSVRQRSSAFAALAETAAVTENRRAAIFAEQAEVSARSIAGRQGALALAAVAKAVAMNGNLDKAQEIARSISVPGQQGAAQAAIVSVTAAKGKIQRATDAALAIHDRYWRAIAQIAVVGALAAAGDTTNAYRLARRVQSQVRHIAHLNQQETVLVGLVKAVAATGRMEQAEAIIPTIATPGRQAEALLALSEVAEPVRATTFIVRAVQLHHWTTSLPALVKARPAVLGSIVREVADIAEPS